MLHPYIANKLPSEAKRLPLVVMKYPYDGRRRKSLALRLPHTTKGLPPVTKKLTCDGEV